jgi:hypothetical protein
MSIDRLRRLTRSRQPIPTKVGARLGMVCPAGREHPSPSFDCVPKPICGAASDGGQKGPQCLSPLEMERRGVAGPQSCEVCAILALDAGFGNPPKVVGHRKAPQSGTRKHERPLGIVCLALARKSTSGAEQMQTCRLILTGAGWRRRVIPSRSFAITRARDPPKSM